MNRGFILFFRGFILGMCLIPLFFSCSRDNPPLRDGYYTAEALEFDSHGWKEFVTICVSGGKIIAVEYNAKNSSGLIKSWDMDYMRIMNAADGTYPNEYTRIYGAQLLSRQGSGEIDVLSGATNSYHSFCLLAEAVLAKSKAGDTSVALIQINTLADTGAPP
ncbi:MAG: FMN-binding protein [Treponema sp.]|jgi:major membrane immunogen (membrane-anchored lipoprotein)|nr:FMN-binding protein [Treponema sp.]